MYVYINIMVFIYCRREARLPRLRHDERGGCYACIPGGGGGGGGGGVCVCVCVCVFVCVRVCFPLTHTPPPLA